MLINTRRRILAACASALLVFDLLAVASSSASAVTTGTISGKVTDEGGTVLGGVQITVFKLVGGTWQDQQIERATNGSGSSIGTYSLNFEPGTYRVAFHLSVTNEIDDGGDYFGQYYPDTTTASSATDIVVTAGSTHPGVNAKLHYTGGTISGTVKDIAGAGIAFAEVRGFRTDRDYGGGTPTHLGADIQASADKNGHYVLRTRGEPVWLHFSGEGYVAEYFDNTQVWTDGPVLDAPTGTALVGKNAELAAAPLVNVDLPVLHAKSYVGGTSSVHPGAWSSGGAKFSYQWIRISGSTETPISKATHQTYKATSHDLGKKLRVDVTASQIGTTSVTVSTNVSGTIKIGTTMSFKASSPKKHVVTMQATVKKSTGSSASGTVKFGCGTKFVTMYSHTSTLKSGKAAVTFKGIPKGHLTCTARYSGKSNVAGSSKTKKVSVK